MGHLKKVLIAVVMGSLALLLVGPASALADRPLPAPPWDDDPSHWTGVEVTECWSDPGLPGVYPNGDPCEDHVTVDNLLLTATPPLPPQLVECKIDLDVKVWRDGETEVDNVTATANGGFNEAGCDNVIIHNDEPWDNQICERIADENGPLMDHQYWDALEIDFTYGSRLSGVIYAELLDGSGNRASGSSPLPVGSVSVDSDVYFPNIPPPPTFHLADDQIAPFDNDPSFTVESTEDPCQWEFPS